MSRCQLKIACHTKSQEDLKLNAERQSTDASAETTEMLGLRDNPGRAANMNVLHGAITNTGCGGQMKTQSQQRKRGRKEEPSGNFEMKITKI